MTLSTAVYCDMIRSHYIDQHYSRYRLWSSLLYEKYKSTMYRTDLILPHFSFIAQYLDINRLFPVSMRLFEAKSEIIEYNIFYWASLHIWNSCLKRSVITYWSYTRTSFEWNASRIVSIQSWKYFFTCHETGRVDCSFRSVLFTHTVTSIWTFVRLWCASLSEYIFCLIYIHVHRLQWWFYISVFPVSGYSRFSSYFQIKTTYIFPDAFPSLRTSWDSYLSSSLFYDPPSMEIVLHEVCETLKLVKMFYSKRSLDFCCRFSCNRFSFRGLTASSFSLLRLEQLSTRFDFIS